ncbi:MAG: DMT family transporter [Deltaproteobacteria bacterium]|jgi:drug/metabolite transporter (DMT)-like permease|nr:DMT family transporter [Deltaproteobacteria bacterium]
MTNNIKQKDAKFTTSVAFGIICAFLATLVWSGNFIAGRALAPSLSPMILVLLRCTLASLIMLPLAWRPLKADWPVIRANLRFCALLSLLGITGANVFVYMAAHSTSAVNLSIISICTPLCILLLTRIFFAERLGLTRIIGLCITISGVLVLISRGEAAVLLNLHFQSGDLLMFGNVLSFAVYTLLLRKLPRGISLPSLLFMLMAMGGLFVIPGAIWEFVAGPPPVFNWAVFGGIVYVSLGSSLLAYGLWNIGIERAGSARTSIVYYSMPLFCGIEAIIILNEPVTLMHTISITLIIAGLFTAMRTPKSAKKL